MEMTLISKYIYDKIFIQKNKQIIIQHKENIVIDTLKRKFYCSKVYQEVWEGSDEKKKRNSCSRLLDQTTTLLLGQTATLGTTLPIYYPQSGSFLDVLRHSETEN